MDTGGVPDHILCSDVSNLILLSYRTGCERGYELSKGNSMSRYGIWTNDDNLEVFVGFDEGMEGFFLTINPRRR